jgi:MFS family permease/molybdopterin converting factor small subunit
VTRVTFLIPSALQPLTEGRSRLRVDVPRGSPSLGEALEALWAIYPAVRDRVLTEQGEVRPHVNVFVGTESSRWSGGLTTPVPDGAEISILPAVSGGSGGPMANRWVALAIVFVARTSMGYQFQSVASVGPLLVPELGLTWAQLGTLIGLYMLPGAFFALPGGMLGRRLGERRTVVASLALMVLGGLVTAASHGFGPAAAGRLSSGVGAVLMNILLAKMVADWFTEGELTTAMAIMLSSWPVGLGLAAATLGGLATHTSWRMAVATTALAAVVGLLLIAFAYPDPPRAQSAAPGPAARRAQLPRREVRLAVSAGFAWGCFNASLVAVVAFGPAVLVARGLSLGDAGFIVSLAIWVTILSVPLGGLLTDRLGRPNLVIVAGSIVAGLATLLLPVLPHPLLAFGLLGLVTGAPPGAVMALLPKTVAPERLTTALGVYYTVFYVVMALTQLAAGAVRDATGSPAAPIVFAAAVMAATVLGLAVFRLVERAAPSVTADRVVR